MKTKEFLSHLLVSRGINAPDGRLLYLYNMTDEEATILKSALNSDRGYDIMNTHSLSCHTFFMGYVLLGSWLYARKWEDGRASYELLNTELGLDFGKNNPSRYVELGLKKWHVSVLETEETSQYLYTMIYAGGLPPIALKEAGKITQIVLKSVQLYEQYQVEWEPLFRYKLNNQFQYDLPSTLQNLQILNIILELTTRVHRFLEQFVPKSDPSSERDWIAKNYQEYFFPPEIPIFNPDSLKQFMVQLIKEVNDKKRSGTPRVQLSVRSNQNGYEFSTRLIRPNYISESDFYDSEAGAFETLRLCMDYESQCIGLARRYEKNLFKVDDTNFVASPTMGLKGHSFFLFAQGRRVATLKQEYQGIDKNLPLVFEKSGEGWKFCGQTGTIHTTKDYLLLVFLTQPGLDDLGLSSTTISGVPAYTLEFFRHVKFSFAGHHFDLKACAEENQNIGLQFQEQPVFSGSLPVFDCWPTPFATEHADRFDKVMIRRSNYENYEPLASEKSTSGYYEMLVEYEGCNLARAFIYWPGFKSLKFNKVLNGRYEIRFDSSGIQSAKVRYKDCSTDLEKSGEISYSANLSISNLISNITLILVFDSGTEAYLDLDVKPDGIILLEQSSKRRFLNKNDYLCVDALGDLSVLGNTGAETQAMLEINFPVEWGLKNFSDFLDPVYQVVSLQKLPELATGLKSLLGINSGTRMHLPIRLHIPNNTSAEFILCQTDINLNIDAKNNLVKMEEGAWNTLPDSVQNQAKIMAIALHTTEPKIQLLEVEKGWADLQQIPAGVYCLLGQVLDLVRADRAEPYFAGIPKGAKGLAKAICTKSPGQRGKAIRHSIQNLMADPLSSDWRIIHTGVKALKYGPAVSIPWYKFVPESEAFSFFCGYFVAVGYQNPEVLNFISDKTPILWHLVPQKHWIHAFQNYRLALSNLIPDDRLRSVLVYQEILERLNSLIGKFDWFSLLKNPIKSKMPEALRDWHPNYANVSKEQFLHFFSDLGKRSENKEVPRSQWILKNCHNSKQMKLLLPWELHGLSATSPLLTLLYGPFLAAMIASEKIPGTSLQLNALLKVIYYYDPSWFDIAYRYALQHLNKE